MHGGMSRCKLDISKNNGLSKLNLISSSLQDSISYATKKALDAAYSKWPQSRRLYIGFPCDPAMNASLLLFSTQPSKIRPSTHDSKSL